MQEDKHFKYGYIHALSASVPLIKVIVDHTGQEFDNEESIDIFKDIFHKVNEITLSISRSLALDVQAVRQRSIYISILKNNMEIASKIYENEISQDNSKENLIINIEKTIKDQVTHWHQLPYIESASGSTNEQMIRLQSCSFEVLTTLYQSVSNFPGGRTVHTTVNELCLYIKNLVEDITKEYFNEIEDESIGIIQSELLIMIGKIISREWERYVRDYFRAGISPDRNRIKYMLSSFTNSLKKKPLGVKDVDLFVDEMIDVILKVAKEAVSILDSGSLEYNDMYERYIISRCCIISSWMWEHIAENIGDKLDDMDLSEEERHLYEIGEKALMTPDIFGKEMYDDITQRIMSEDYSVDMDDFVDLTKEVVINYLGISEFINDMDIKI